MSVPESLKNGGYCEVPEDVAVCPECGSKLMAECEGWDEETGAPMNGGLHVDCIALDRLEDDTVPYREVAHRHWQSDWQPVIDAVEQWCGAVES